MSAVSVESSHLKKKFSFPNNDLNNDEISDTKLSTESSHNLSDPNLTLISVYSPDALPKMQINVQRSISATADFQPTQLFPLFRIPQSTSIDTSTLNTQLLEPIDGIASNPSSSITKPLVEGLKKRKEDKTNRFISFVRYLFCQIVPLRSNATVTPTIDNPPTEENQIIPPVPAKVNSISNSGNRIFDFRKLKFPYEIQLVGKRFAKLFYPLIVISFEQFPMKMNYLTNQCFHLN
jgi:hypothetical protein